MQELKKINNDDIDFTLPPSAIENILPIKFAEDEILQKIEWEKENNSKYKTE